MLFQVDILSAAPIIWQSVSKDTIGELQQTIAHQL